MLLERLREGLRRPRLPRLTRLRAVMRDCVEETMALLRGEDDLEEEGEETFPTAATVEPAAPAWDPLASGFNAATIQTPPASAATTCNSRCPTGNGGGAAAAAETPAAPSGEPAPRQASASAADWALDRASRLRRDLPERRGGKAADRPAPAPSSLSDLRVWLPERDDLPHAS